MQMELASCGDSSLCTNPECVRKGAPLQRARDKGSPLTTALQKIAPAKVHRWTRLLWPTQSNSPWKLTAAT